MFMPHDPTGADARRRKLQAQAAAKLVAQSMVTAMTVGMIRSILEADDAMRRPTAVERASMFAA